MKQYPDDSSAQHVMAGIAEAEPFADVGPAITALHAAGIKARPPAVPPPATNAARCGHQGASPCRTPACNKRCTLRAERRVPLPCPCLHQRKPHAFNDGSCINVQACELRHIDFQ